MEPNFMPLGDVFSQMIPLYIPTYQRGFAWDQSEISEFIDDVEKIYKAGSSNKSHKHFFGGIITILKGAPKTKHRMKYEVVDGQQRLATFSITISIIVSAYQQVGKEAQKSKDDAAKKLAQLELEELRDNYLIDYRIDREKNERVPLPRLELSEEDDAYFQSILQGDAKRPPRNAPASNKRLYKAWKLIKDNLVFPIVESNTSANGKLDNLKALTDHLLYSCNVIFIWSGDSDEAYQLFVVLNDRGKSLNNGDLLRAHTLHLLDGHPNLQRHAKDNWNEILRPSTTHVDGFLAAYYPSTIGERSRKPDIFADYRKKVFNELTSPLANTDAVAVERTISNMHAEQQNYLDIVDCKWPYENTNLKTWHHGRLKRLVNSLRHNLCVPLLLTASKHLPETQFCDLLCLLERFVFRYIIIVGAHANPLRDIYYKYSVLIRSQHKLDFDAFEKELRQLSKNRASDKVFSTLMREGELDYADETQQKRYIKHFLITLDDYSDWFEKNRHNNNVGRPKPKTLMYIDIDVATIEHVYPQKAKVKNTELERLVNDIGNLALLDDGDNSKLGNRPFIQKRPVLQSRQVHLTSTIANQSGWRKNDPKVHKLKIDDDEWTHEAVNDRRELLIEMALKVFAI